MLQLDICAENILLQFLAKKVQQINFVYKKRLDYYSYSSKYGPREKRNILLIDSKRKTLAYLVPKQDGWSNEVILDLAKTLAELSIKQIVEKYNDDEIAL